MGSLFTVYQGSGGSSRVRLSAQPFKHRLSSHPKKVLALCFVGELAVAAQGRAREHLEIRSVWTIDADQTPSHVEIAHLLIAEVNVVLLRRDATTGERKLGKALFGCKNKVSHEAGLQREAVATLIRRRQ